MIAPGQLCLEERMTRDDRWNLVSGGKLPPCGLDLDVCVGVEQSVERALYIAGEAKWYAVPSWVAYPAGAITH